MQGALETVRQIVEFEELVSRLDRINDVVLRPSSLSPTPPPPPPPYPPPPTPPPLPPRPSPPPPPPPPAQPSSSSSSPSLFPTNDCSSSRCRCCSPSTSSLNSSTTYDYLGNIKRPISVVDQQQSVRVHIGIDEDLRMILEMDPSIVDRTPTPVVLPNNHSANISTLVVDQQQSVRVHIGIDEDLRMILEMDPSIVDRTPTPVVLPNNHSANISTLSRSAMRVTRPQGWLVLN
ncbi:hypothetical protein M0802_011231 [Mischocyttarus mexicanus]|nr:hypothetical protein M0802_011231 [Mischocyttarus mexicanus]